MMSTQDILLLMGGLNTLISGIIIAYFKAKHDENKERLDNLCDSCVYDYTPIELEKKEKVITYSLSNR